MDKYINPSNFNYSRFGINKSPFKDKIVIIGSSLEEDNDFVITPYYTFNGIENLMPGVELHANAIQQIIDGDYLNLPISSLKLTDKSILNQIFILLTLTILGLYISLKSPITSSSVSALKYMLGFSNPINIEKEDFQGIINPLESITIDGI